MIKLDAYEQAQRKIDKAVRELAAIPELPSYQLDDQLNDTVSQLRRLREIIDRHNRSKSNG